MGKSHFMLSNPSHLNHLSLKLLFYTLLPEKTSRNDVNTSKNQVRNISLCRIFLEIYLILLSL